MAAAERLSLEIGRYRAGDNTLNRVRTNAYMFEGMVLAIAIQSFEDSNRLL